MAHLLRRCRRFWCLCMLSLRWQAKSQSLHLKGLMSSWVWRCLLNFQRSGETCPHFSHLNACLLLVPRVDFFWIFDVELGWLCLSSCASAAAIFFTLDVSLCLIGSTSIDFMSANSISPATTSIFGSQFTTPCWLLGSNDRFDSDCLSIASDLKN